MDDTASLQRRLTFFVCIVDCGFLKFAAMRSNIVTRAKIDDLGQRKRFSLTMFQQEVKRSTCRSYFVFWPYVTYDEDMFDLSRTCFTNSDLFDAISWHYFHNKSYD